MKIDTEEITKKVISTGKKTIKDVTKKGQDVINDTKKNLQIKKIKEEIFREKVRIGENVVYRNMNIDNLVVIKSKEKIEKLKVLLEQKQLQKNKI